MSSRKHSRLTTLAILILVIAASAAAGATSPLREKPSGPVVVKRVVVIHGDTGVEIEITGSGPMRIKTSRLSDPERLVIDVQDSIQDSGLGALYIPEGTPEIKSVRIGRLYQPGESITRVVVEMSSQDKAQVGLAIDKLKVKLHPSELDKNVARREKPEPSAGAIPAARGGLSARRQSPSVEAKRDAAVAVLARTADLPPRTEKQAETASVGLAAEIRARESTPAPVAAAVDRASNVNAPTPAHGQPAAAIAPSRPAVPETVKVEGIMSQPRRMLAKMAPMALAVQPPPAPAPPEPVKMDGLASKPRRVPAEMAAMPIRPPAVQPPPVAQPPEPVRIEGIASKPRRVPAEMAAMPSRPPAVQPSPVAAHSQPIRIEGMLSQPPAVPAEMAAIPVPAPKPVEDNREHETASVAASAVPDITVANSKPVAHVPALGAGVTGKAKDATLGSDEEAAIRATIPPDNRIPAPRKGEAPLPVALLLSGAATAGYYQESTSSGQVSQEASGAQQASPVGSVRFDASGYVHSPGFLNFTIKPQGSVGRPPSEGVFPDGEGVFASATLFGSGVTPLTVNYHRLNRKVVSFGPLDQLAGLEANTFQDSLSASWKLRLKRLPELGLNYANYSSSYEPLMALAPKTANAGRLLSADLTETALGWNLQTRYKVERSSQDLINIFDPTQAPLVYKRNDQDIRASASRDFGKWLSTSFVAGKTKSENEVQGRPFDQSFRFLTGNSFFRVGKKLTFGVRAGVTDNVVGAFLQSVTGGTGLPAQPIVFIPSTAKLRMVNYSGSAQYAVTHDLHLQADLVRETTSAPPNSTIASSTSELTSLQASVAFVHRFRRWQLQSYYAANGGRLVYAATGSSRSSGQRADLSATIGSLQSLELTAGVHGGLQNVTGSTSMYDRIAGANVALSRALWDRWRVRAGYDRERDQYNFSSSRFSSVSNGISVGIVHPLVGLTASHNVRDGLTFQADPRLQFVSSTQGGLLLGAFPGTLVVPTGADWSSAVLSFHPVPKFTGRVAWLKNQQKLQGAVSNSYTELEASAGYQFRAMSLDIGYVYHDQNFATDMFKRNRFFFRAVREFTIF